ncbi:hypothetical protein M728_005580 (plasmid) [Ensifer sp. WSM1721]
MCQILPNDMTPHDGNARALFVALGSAAKILGTVSIRADCRPVARAVAIKDVASVIPAGGHIGGVVEISIIGHAATSDTIASPAAANSNLRLLAAGHVSANAPSPVPTRRKQ